MTFNSIETIHHTNLRPAPWRATHVLKPDLKLLKQSMRDYGWLSVVVATQEGTIIDGFHRWYLAGSDKQLLKRFDGQIPVLRRDVDEIDARIMHVRMNRARGEVIPRYLSLLVRDVVRSGKYDEETVRKELAMGVDEWELLIDGTLLMQQKIAEYEYSKAWVPIETNSGGVAPKIERPPNADR